MEPNRKYIQLGEIGPCSDAEHIIHPLFIQNNDPGNKVYVVCDAHPFDKQDVLPQNRPTEKDTPERTLQQRLANYCLTCPRNVGYRPSGEIDPFKWA